MRLFREKYVFQFQDLKLESYLKKDADGYFTCAICHSPITPEQPFDTVKSREGDIKGKVHCHKGCMLLIAKFPLKYPPMVDMLRKASFEKYGDRS